MEPIITFENITKHFFGVPALKGVSLSVMQGEIIGLIGKTKRPVLDFFARLRMKVGEERGSK